MAQKESKLKTQLARLIHNSKILYSKMLLDCIRDEKRGEDYCYPKEDKPILKKMLREINKFAGTNYHYLAELDEFNIPGSGEIMAQYITRFSSEDIRGYLVPQLVFDKVKDCDKLVLQLYLHFKA